MFSYFSSWYKNVIPIGYVLIQDKLKKENCYDNNFYYYQLKENGIDEWSTIKVGCVSCDEKQLIISEYLNDDNDTKDVPYIYTEYERKTSTYKTLNGDSVIRFLNKEYPYVNNIFSYFKSKQVIYNNYIANKFYNCIFEDDCNLKNRNGNCLAGKRVRCLIIKTSIFTINPTQEDPNHYEEYVSYEEFI